jgi:GT2 family glycosyltransferase
MTSGNAPEIAVIIVNYNTALLALEAVESVLSRKHGGLRIEVHLIDNASPNGDAAVLTAAMSERDWDERVTLYQESTNHGFGRGNNIVLTALGANAEVPRYVFLLNPDARLEHEAIAILADFLDRNPTVTVAGAHIEKPGGIPVTAAFRFPGVISTFDSALSFGPIARLLSRWQIPLPPDILTSRVDWVSGAAVMFRMSELQRIGFFDPAYFLYFEETDLMLQFAHQGGQVWHVAEAHVIHAEGAATDVKSGRCERRRLPAYWYQSWEYYFRKNYGRHLALAAAAAWLLGDLLNRIINGIRGREPAAPLAFHKDFWVGIARPLLGFKAVRHDR